MNRRIRQLGIGLVACYVALFISLNYWQVLRADDLNADPRNTRQAAADFARERGRILTADGVVAAESVPVDTRYEWLRTYPQGDLLGHVTGWFSFLFGTDGIERQYDAELAGRTVEQRVRGFADLFVPRRRLADVTLTVRADVQRAARDALGEQEGSVVAVDPRTGAVLALWSWPSYDPNLLSTHDFDMAREARALFLLDPRNPLRASSYRDRYFPGSTFKVVTGVAGLESGGVTAVAPEYPVETEWTPPQTTRPIRNSGGACGGPLPEIMRVSCNTSFARMGVDLGAQRMVDTATAFGFNRDVPIDLPRPVQSVYPPVEAFADDIPKLAQTAFGQNEVQATPLQMAMVAAAVANGGTLMQPYVMRDIRDADGTVTRRTLPTRWSTVMSPASAATMRDAMVGVVTSGTGQRAQIPGVSVAGKTGTAQLGTDPPSSHAWFVSFAPAEAPRVAVAVIVEGQPGVSEVTGGRLAAPIARAVMEAVLAAPDPLAPGGG